MITHPHDPHSISTVHWHATCFEPTPAECMKPGMPLPTLTVIHPHHPQSHSSQHLAQDKKRASTYPRTTANILCAPSPPSPLSQSTQKFNNLLTYGYIEELLLLWVLPQVKRGSTEGTGGATDYSAKASKRERAASIMLISGRVYKATSCQKHAISGRTHRASNR